MIYGNCVYFFPKAPLSCELRVVFLAQSHMAQNIAETCQKYFQSFIASEILLQHYNFNFLKYFCK